MKRALPLAAIAFVARAVAQQSASEHVPPDPPQSRVHEMPYDEMAKMMGMDDRRPVGKVMLDRVEWHDADQSTFEWEAAAWYGGDFNKVRIETEGARVSGDTRDARFELLWDRIVTPWWNLHLGVREDAGDGPARTSAALGLAGIAPGFVDVEAAAYLGEDGRSAFRLTTRRDFLLTQRWIFAPEAEGNAYDRGGSDLKLGLRIRYEIRRELAPYLGVRWERRFNRGAASQVTALAGIRAWF